MRRHLRVRFLLVRVCVTLWTGLYVTCDGEFNFISWPHAKIIFVVTGRLEIISHVAQGLFESVVRIASTMMLINAALGACTMVLLND